MPFQIIWTREAQKNLRKRERQLSERIYGKISAFNEQDLLLLEKVHASSLYKYRIGKYRVFFEKGPQNTLFVVSIRHRKNAYKKTQ